MGLGDECDDVGAYLAVGEVPGDAVEGVVDRLTALIDMAVCLGYVVNLVLSEALALKYVGVDAEVAGGVVGDDDVRRDVAGDAAAAFDQHPLADVGVLVDDDV